MKKNKYRRNGEGEGKISKVNVKKSISAFSFFPINYGMKSTNKGMHEANTPKFMMAQNQVSPKIRKRVTFCTSII